MRTLFSLLSVIAFGVASRHAGAQASVLTHVNVVDVATGKIQRDQDVTVEGAVISSVAAASVAGGAEVFDFSGAYVIPGLWDMNAHVSGLNRSALAALLASGVVGVRDADEDNFSKASFRDSIEAGLLPGPHIILSARARRARAVGVAREASMSSDTHSPPGAERASANETTLQSIMRLVRSAVPFTSTPMVLRVDPAVRRSLRLMAEAGVLLLAGSDAGSAFVPAGYSLTDQLIGLVTDAGLTPLQSVQSATTNVARSLGMSVTYGSVSAGHAADFVVLDKNPLENITNLKEVRAVVRGGKIYDRIALDSLVLAEAR